MPRRRLYWLAALLGSVVFASFFGGPLAYGLLWTALLTPLAALGYNLFVYLRFKVFQRIESKSVVKGEMTPFTLVLANEDLMAFHSLHVAFFTETSTLYCPGLEDAWSLTHGQQVRLEATLRCNYRGEYPVGVQTVQVRDFLGLFSLTYPIRSQINATVLPRILRLPSLNLLPAETDAKRSRFSLAHETETLDTETRAYVRGDSPRQIHWKVTARQGELYTRKLTSDPKTAVVLCMDTGRLSPCSQLERLQTEDQIIEGTLAAADYCLRQRMQCLVCTGKNQTFQISNQAELDLFCGYCGAVRFDREIYADQLLRPGIAGPGAHYIVFTHRLTPELYTTAAAIVGGGSHLAVALSAANTTPDQADLAALFTQGGIQLCVLAPEDRLEARFTEGVAV